MMYLMLWMYSRIGISRAVYIHEGHLVDVFWSTLKVRVSGQNIYICRGGGGWLGGVGGWGCWREELVKNAVFGHFLGNYYILVAPGWTCLFEFCREEKRWVWDLDPGRPLKNRSNLAWKTAQTAQILSGFWAGSRPGY